MKTSVKFVMDLQKLGQYLFPRIFLKHKLSVKFNLSILSKKTRLMYFSHFVCLIYLLLLVCTKSVQGWGKHIFPPFFLSQLHLLDHCTYNHWTDYANRNCIWFRTSPIHEFPTWCPQKGANSFDAWNLNCYYKIQPTWKQKIFYCNF